MTLDCSGLQNGQSRVISFCSYCSINERGDTKLCRPSIFGNLTLPRFQKSVFYLMTLLSTSSFSMAANCSRDMAPRSSPARCRPEPVPFSMSRSPTTTI